MGREGPSRPSSSDPFGIEPRTVSPRLTSSTYSESQTRGRYVQRDRLHDLIDQLEQWFYIGAGCTVASQWPPELSGAIPHDVGAQWSFAARLAEYGLLTYDQDGRGTYHPPSG